MIEINLLPQELRVRKDKKPGAAPAIDPKVLLYAVPVVVGVLLVAHVYLFALIGFRSYRLAGYNSQWQKLTPQKSEWDVFKKKFDVLSQDALITQGLVSQRILWSQKLNKISMNLPSGVWLNEITLSRKDFTIKGSAVSLKKEEMGLINSFTESLKKDQAFYKDFTSLELTSFQVRTIGGYDTVEFILTGVLK